MVELRNINLDQELSFWTDKGKLAIQERSFTPVVVGYWEPGSVIIEEQESRHFCLSFTAPKNQREMGALQMHLKLQLLYNNAAACVYVGAQKIKGAMSETALIALGDNKKEKVCWVTPFTMKGKEATFFDTVTTDPSVFSPWDSILARDEDVTPDMDKTIRELHAYLRLKETLSDDGKDIDDYFSRKGVPNPFLTMAAHDVFSLCILYIAARTKPDDL